MLRVGDLFFQYLYSCQQEICETADLSIYNSRPLGDMAATVLSECVFVGVDRALLSGLLIGSRLTAGHAGVLEYEGSYHRHPGPNLSNTSEFSNSNHLKLPLRLQYFLGT